MKSNTNKLLIIILFVLLCTFVLTKIFRSPARESNLDTDLFGIDTAQISSIKFTRARQADLTLRKNDSAWTITDDAKTANAESSAVENLLRTLSQLKPERIVSRKSEKWDTYQVSDTTSVHVMAYDRDEEELINWHVGKESQGITYVRPGDEDAVYSIDGLLRGRVDKDFSAWRDKTLLRLRTDDINKITFQYPADSGFVLRKDGNRWMIDTQEADSASVQRYFNKLKVRTATDLVESLSPALTADVTVTIERTKASPAVIKAWKGPEGNWTLSSSFQEGVYFRDATAGKDLFAGKRSLLQK